MVQFLTQVDENRLKIIENNIIKTWCFSLSLYEVITKFEKLWDNKIR
jgi:hypothetical protein